MTGPEQAVREQMSDRRRTGALLIAVALVLGIALGFVYRTDREMQNVSHRSSVLEEAVVANGQIAQEAKEGVEEANRRLRAAGKPTVPVPTVSPVSPPATTEKESSVSVEQVRSIVVTELAQSKARLSQAEINQIARVAASMVPKPADGKTPTAAELQPVVIATVAAYCVGDKCVGRPGGKGDTGDAGAKGDPAPKVTDEELLESSKIALAAYCGLESEPCRGPQGEPGASVTGPPGAAGEQGRSVIDMDCIEDGRWRITYDRPLPNGETTAYSRGPCRILPIEPTN